MAVYTQLSNSQVEKLAGKFGLQVKDFSPVKGGACNSNFLLKTKQGPHMLTLVEERTEEETAVLAKLLLWLEANDYPTTCLRKTKQKKNYALFSDKVVLAKKYLKGKVYPKLNARQVKQLGKSLGQLHTTPLPKFLPDYHYYENPVFESTIGMGIDKEYEKWLKKRLAYFKKTMPANMPRGLVHGDLFCDNVIFNKNKLNAIIDFEEACDYYLIFDIGMTIIGVCMNGTSVVTGKARALLKAYQKIRPLKKKEIYYLQYFMEYAAVRTSNWRIWKYHVNAPSPKRKNKHREMMAIAETVRAMPSKKFLNNVLK